jgi:hypothetical protein
MNNSTKNQVAEAQETKSAEKLNSNQVTMNNQNQISMKMELLQKQWLIKPHMNNGPKHLHEDLWYYADAIYEIIDYCCNMADLNQIVLHKYKALNGLMKKLLQENSGYLHLFDNFTDDEQYDLIVDADIEDYTNLIRLVSFIDVTTMRSKSDYWQTKTKSGYYPSVILLYQLWNALNYELHKTHNLLKSLGLCPDEPVATPASIEESTQRN